MRIFKTKGLTKFARQENIDDASLVEAISRAERGIIDADLGGGLIKQRIPRQGHGRSGGYRTIIVYRAQDRAVFLFGFAKNDRENIGHDELSSWKQIALKYLNANEEVITKAIEDGLLKEIGSNEELED